jgi:hypothetical protein
MVEVSEANTQRSSKVVLNQETLIFKNNVEEAINLINQQNGEPVIA